MVKNKKTLKRRANILYKLRRKGVRCNTKERTIFYPYGQDPWQVIQIVRLSREFNFYVQLTIE